METTLWSEVKQLVLLQPYHTAVAGFPPYQYFREIYSCDEIVLCLRAVFAEWTENFVLITSPSTFLRGLTYKVDEKLLKWKTSESTHSNFESLSRRLQKYKTALFAVQECPERSEQFYLKFIKGFAEELKLLSSQRNLPLEHLPIPENLWSVREYEMDIDPVAGACFREEIDSQMTFVKSGLPKLWNELIKHVASAEENIGAIQRIEWHATYYNDPSAIVQVHPETAGILPVAIGPASLNCFWQEAEKVYLCKKNVIGAVRICSEIVRNLGCMMQCVERKQQITAIGIKGLLVEPDLDEINSYTNKMLEYLPNMNSLLSKMQVYDEGRIKFHIAQMIAVTTNPQRSVEDYTLSRNDLCQEVQEIRSSLLRAILSIQKQPHQVKKTDVVNSVTLKLLNYQSAFNNQPLSNIEVLLIKEETAKVINSCAKLPTKIPKAAVFEITTRQRGRRNSNGRKVEFSRDGTSLQITYDFCLKNVERDKENGRVDHANVYKQKYALLFVANFCVDNEIVQIWKMSLPMAVITHTSQDEGGWGIVSWGNTFPLPNRKCFELQPFATGQQVLEMLRGLFEEWVGVPLKPSHVIYVKNKLFGWMRSKNLDLEEASISWTALCVDFMEGGFSLFAWFYRAAKLLKDHDNFREAFIKGYIEGFISWEDAHSLLLNSNVKPSTFLLRFSDSESGSLSLIYRDLDNNVYRVQPFEFFKQTSLKDCRKTFLELLDVKNDQDRTEAFQFVYPNICKREAFKAFYQISPSPSPPPIKKPHYVPLVRTVGPPMSPLPKSLMLSSSQSSTSGQGMGEFSGDEDQAMEESDFFTLPCLQLRNPPVLINEETIMDMQENLEGLFKDLLTYDTMSR